MYKKQNVLIIFILIFLMSPIKSLASGMSQQYLPPANSDYRGEKISWQIYLSYGITKLRITQFSYGYPKEVIETVTWNVEENSTVWVDMTCMGDTSFEFLDASGKVKGIETRGQSESYLGQGTCEPGKTIKPSDYNEEQNQYASDTFGGTKPKLNNPPTPDGSGGKGETGYKGIDDGTNNGGDNGSDGGDNGGGEDSGEGGNDGSCGACKVLECPGWNEYMDKIDDIAGKIPPPPNWDDVAGKFRDTIVPKVIDDLGDLLGRAPAKPTPPPALPSNDDHGINNNRPSMQDTPNIPQFDADDIKNGAPPIPEREDPTGGFDLIDNPMDTLPDAPINPKPGETDPGEWGQNKPKEDSNPFPFPEDQGEPNIGTPPKPSDNGASPPTPGGNVGNAPIPGGDYGTPPSTGGELPGMKDYKPNPSAPDGSGRDIYP